MHLQQPIAKTFVLKSKAMPTKAPPPTLADPPATSAPPCLLNSALAGTPQKARPSRPSSPKRTLQGHVPIPVTHAPVPQPAKAAGTQPSDDRVVYSIIERGQFVTLANRDYDGNSSAIVSLGYSATLRSAEQTLLVRGAIRSITAAWTAETTTEEKAQTLVKLLNQWEREAMYTELWEYEGPLITAKITAVGSLVSELPLGLHSIFANSIIWSKQGQICDTWHSVARNMKDRGLRFADSNRATSAQIIST